MNLLQIPGTGKLMSFKKKKINTESIISCYKEKQGIQRKMCHQSNKNWD